MENERDTYEQIQKYYQTREYIMQNYANLFTAFAKLTCSKEELYNDGLFNIKQCLNPREEEELLQVIPDLKEIFEIKEK